MAFVDVTFSASSETTPTGQQVVVNMRPNGDILKVITIGAGGDEEAEAAVTAAAKEAPAKKKAKKATPNVQ